MNNVDLDRKKEDFYGNVAGVTLILFCSSVFFLNKAEPNFLQIMLVYMSPVSFIVTFYFYFKATSLTQKREEKEFLDFKNQFDSLFKADKIFIRKDRHLILGYNDDGNIFIMKKEKDKPEIYSKLISYKDILSVEILADDKSIEKAQRESKVGAGLMGTILFGIPGLIIGGILNKGDIRKLELCLMINDTNNPYEKILFNTTKVWSGSDLLKIDIKDWFAVCSILIERADKEDLEKESNGVSSISDELLKLNDLKEKGILTDEEFQTQKLRLLA